MRGFFGLIAWFFLQILKASLFLFKIFFTYELHCFRDVKAAIEQEWQEREIDHEKYPSLMKRMKQQ